MKELPSFVSLVDSFGKLPGIGSKSAERMAAAVLDMKEEDAIQFAKAIENARNLIHTCPNCGLFTENDLCEVCSSDERNRHLCIVIAKPKDANAFEKIKGLSPVYHVLGGLVSPGKGVGPEDLNIAGLFDRLEQGEIEEIVLALNPTIEGETTSLLLSRMLNEKYPSIKVTRLGYGLPMGSSLDYADSLTLQKALEGRKSL